jgi:cell division FtsZ-interacting protein ZapD
MARPRVGDEERVPTAIRLPVTLHQWLHAEAEAREVSANLLVTHAVAEYLDRLTPLEQALGTVER